MRFGLSVLLAIVVAAILAAQAPPRPQQPTFRAGVNFVRVDVFPTLDGRPVPDLNKGDFEVLEDGVVQAVETFEHVVVRPRDVTAERVEPRDLSESNRMAADARNRLFVLFLDTYHVTESSVSHNGLVRSRGSTTTKVPPKQNPIGTRDIDRALVNFLDRTIGLNDLFAAVTPEMEVEQLTFTRRPETFEELVHNVWGRRFSWDDLDPEEERWSFCYPPDDICNCYPAILLDMVRRRREALTLQSLGRLVQRLGEVREERKAVLLISEGWALFRPDMQLARPLPMVSDPPVCKCPPLVPSEKGIYVGPGGKLTTGRDPREGGTVDWQQCESARATMAHVDNDRLFRDLMDEANRANTSFYPIDPRGLAVFATPIDYKDLPQTPTSMQTAPADKALVADAADLRLRLEALRNLASATDGSMTETNDLKGGLKKISDDLSDYYLLGYYSTNAKADGTFRKITVRVKRPGVTVRARRGYLAPTEAELAARRAAAAAVDPEVQARETALGALGTIRADRPFLMTAGVAWQNLPASTPRAVVWVTGELDAAAAREMAWSAGVQASVSLVGDDGQPVASEHARVSSAARSFLLQLPVKAAGAYLVRARAQGQPGTGADASEQVRVVIPGAPPDARLPLAQPLLFRRGPFSGPGFQPTADLRFRRAERVRVDVPLAFAVPASAVSARLLDRKGQELAVPAAASLREDAGLRLASAEVALAPLAFGDYLIEVSVRQGDTTRKVLAAVRIVP